MSVSNIFKDAGKMGALQHCTFQMDHSSDQDDALFDLRDNEGDLAALCRPMYYSSQVLIVHMNFLCRLFGQV